MGETYSLRLAGHMTPVTVRRTAMAKRLTLRVDKTSGEVKLTLPQHVGKRTAEKFLINHVDWIVAERQSVEPDQIVETGSDLAFLGEAFGVVFTGVPPRAVKFNNEEIHVGGPVDMAGKRLENWLKKEAGRVLFERAEFHANTLGAQYERVSIGDMKSRWGSCSSSGTLRFSWRLVMAPFEVLDYVAAHEVAHLLEMNHSDKFWAHVARCVPAYKVRRKWLKSEGNKLFKVRFQSA